MGDMMKHYNISGLRFTFENLTDKYLLQQMKSYEISNENGTSDVNIHINMSDTPLSLPDCSCIRVSSLEYWCTEGDFLTYYMIFDDIDGAVIRAVCNSDFSDIHIYAYDVAKALELDDTFYLYNTMSTLMHYIALMHDRLVFHSSSIYADGAGIAFSASSGVGKSTHTGLWLENIKNTGYINDDTPVISCNEGEILISGTPFAGTSGINTNITVPLKAIVFVTRGADNKLVQTDSATAFIRMMSQLKKPVNDDMTEKLISNLNNILSCIPCYIMECNISSDAALVAYKTIFN